jgi:thioredoxin reductase (NADPH)
MYNCIIIGAGPAGLTAAVYCGRAGLSTLVLEKLISGGQASTTNEIENFPGFEKISGPELAMKLEAQAINAGAEVRYENVMEIETDEQIKKVKTSQGVYEANTIILALGAKRKHLGVQGEGKLMGRGVSYCATCDGAFYRGKRVAVIGGGNSALEDAIYLSNLCEKVYLIHRRDEFRGQKALQNSIFANEKIECVFDTVVNEIAGEGRVEKISTQNIKSSKTDEILVSGVFVAIGTEPQNELVMGKIPMNEDGYIIANEAGITPIEGVFVAGDLRAKPLKQIVTAASDGANAAYSVQTHIIEKSINNTIHK